MKTGICDIETSKLAYRLYGDPSSPAVIVETAMGACSAEWWHLAERWSKDFCVLLYDRAGYGLSSPSVLKRTPANIVKELYVLMLALGIRQKAILIGHSLGGLYVQQFARRFPENVCGLIFLDPVSANNGALKQQLSPREYEQSGIDKSRNLRLGLMLTNLKLGFLFRPLLKKAPPFYYYNRFTAAAEEYILTNATQSKTYRSAYAEYQALETGEGLESLDGELVIPEVPLTLICHDPETMIAEIVQYGGANRAIATKVEDMWAGLMKQYLGFSKKAVFRQARKSGHMIHLSDPEIIEEALCGMVGRG